MICLSMINEGHRLTMTTDVSSPTDVPAAR